MDFIVVDAAKSVAGIRRGAHPARTSGGGLSGWSRPTDQKSIQIFFVDMDFIVVDAANSVAGIGRGAHPARPSGGP